MPSRLRMQSFLNVRPGRSPHADELKLFADALKSANRTRLKLAHRLVTTRHFYDWFRERSGFWQESVSRHEGHAKQSFWDLIQIIEELATGFKIIVAQAEKEASDRHADVLAPAILYALEIHTLLMRLLVERYQEVPGRLWGESKALFSAARKQDLALQAQASSSGETVCIQQLFIELSLIGVIDAYRQSPGLLRWIIAYLHRYAAALPLVGYQERPIPIGADSLPGLFLIDPQSENAPIVPWHISLDHPLQQKENLKRCLVLNTEPLEAMLQEHLRLLNQGEDPALIHPILAHLPPMQRQELLEQIWTSLLPDSREASRKDVWGIPLLVHAKFHEIYLRVQKSPPSRVMAHVLAGNGNSRPTPSDKEDACQWRLMDVSNTGMRIACHNGDALDIEVGQVIALEAQRPGDVARAAAQENTPSFEGLLIMQVRWLRQNLRGGIHMGLRKLGEDARAGQLFLDDNHEARGIACLLLQEGNRHNLILSSKLDIQKGQIVRLSERAPDVGALAPRKIKLGAVLAKTRHFRQWEYSYVAS